MTDSIPVVDPESTWAPPRDAHGRVRRPWREREPHCVHSPDHARQPASACSTCSHGEQLRHWGLHWDAWLAENSDSTEARVAAGWQRIVEPVDD